MTDAVRWNGQMPTARSSQQGRPAASAGGGGGGGDNLADILERVLDKGIVIAGDIQINLLDIELLTIKLRLVVASVDRAKEMGIDWWERDPTLSSGHSELEEENRRLRERLERLEGSPHAELDDAEQDDAEIEDAEVEDAEVEDAEVDDAEIQDAEVEDEVGEPEVERAPRARRSRR